MTVVVITTTKTHDENDELVSKLVCVLGGGGHIAILHTAISVRHEWRKPDVKITTLLE